MIARLVQPLVRHPWITLFVLMALTAVAGLSASRAQFDFTPQALFASRDDMVAFSEQAKARFGYEDSRLLVVLEATGTRDVLDGELLTWQTRVAEQLAAIPRVERIDSVPTLKVPQLDLIGGVDVRPAPVIQELPVSKESEDRIRRLMDRSKMVEGSLLSHDRRVGAMFIVFDPAARDVASMQALVKQVQETFASRPPPSDYRLHYTGLPGVRVSVVNDLMADQSFLFPLAGLLFLVTLAVIFRNIAGILIPMTAVMIGLTWTVGIVAFTGEAFNIVTNVLPILVLIIGVSNAIHLVVRYTEEWQEANGNAREATRRTITHMFVPCLLTLVTTALGFLGLATARSRVLQMFGWHAAIGMACLYVSVLLTFAALLPLWKIRGRNGARTVTVPRLARWTAAGGDWVTSRPRLVLVGGFLLCCGSLLAARNLSVNSSITETYGPRHEQTLAVRLVERTLGGVLPLEVILTADAPGRFLEPETYRAVDELGRFAREQREVTSSQSYVDLYQEIYANFRRDDSLRTHLPADTDEDAQRVRQSANQAIRAREAAHPEAFITDDGLQARVIVRVRDVGTERTLALIHRMDEKLNALFPPGGEITARQTGDAYLNAVSMDSFVRDLFASLATAAASVFVMVSILFWSPRVGLMAALPNLAPFAITLGYMGLRGYDLNASNVAVFSISLGLTVDNSIHFLSRFREESRFAGYIPQAVHLTYLGAGQAMVISTLLQGAGLAVLLGSSFVPTQRFAELMGVTMAGTILGDLVLLPACVALFWKERSADPAPGEPPAHSDRTRPERSTAAVPR